MGSKPINTILSVLFVIAIILLAVVVYGVLSHLKSPNAENLISRYMSPLAFALVILAAGVIVWLFFFQVVGVRGTALKYVTAVVVFTIMCILLLQNFNVITTYLEAHLGTWGMIGVLGVIILIVGAGLFLLF